MFVVTLVGRTREAPDRWSAKSLPQVLRSIVEDLFDISGDEQSLDDGPTQHAIDHAIRAEGSILLL